MWSAQVNFPGIWYDSSPDGIVFTGRPAKVIDGSTEAAVIKDGDVFRMWHAAPMGLAYAISSDGVHWTHHPSLVFDPVTGFTVIKDGEGFKMWYASSTGLLYATSDDGIHWRRRGLSLPAGTLEPTPAWDAFMARPTVVRADGVLKMWYAGFGGTSGGIGYATAAP
jgi:hypothetical protein